MIERKTLKLRAKNTMRGNYFKYLFICLFVILLPDIISSFTLNTDIFGKGINLSSPLSVLYLPKRVQIILLGFLLLNLLIDIFLFTPLNVGKTNYFLKSAQGNTDFSSVLSIFGGEDYLNIVKTVFMKYLLIFIWFIVYLVLAIILMLLMEYVSPDFGFFAPILIAPLIPLIMQIYSYFAVEYILSEEPDIKWNECLKKSKSLMRGKRFYLFKLQLSFIGWFLLGMLIFGLGIYLVTPYYESTLTQFYIEIAQINNSYYESDNNNNID